MRLESGVSLDCTELTFHNQKWPGSHGVYLRTVAGLFLDSY